MSKAFDDYINNLEGKSEIDPLEVVRDLRKLHTEELSTREEKITQLDGTIAEKDSSLTAKDEEIRKWKAKNFDLAMQIPSDNPNPDRHGNADDKPDPASIKISDIFKPEVRRRHGL